MQKLKIALLWHHHQPYYKDNRGYYRLPWVGLHAQKDYLDLLLIAEQYPNIKQTINLVPSLLKQLDEYASGTAKDKIIYLREKAIETYTDQDKIDLLANYFMANPHTMIDPYPRYNQLYEKYKSTKSLDLKEQISRFNDAELRDLQIWFNLSWLGSESKKRPEIKQLIEKEMNFSENDRFVVINHIDILLQKVIPKHAELWKKGKIELTTSPFYHPVLPLLCDNSIARVAQPKLELPELEFAHPEDADAQIKKGLEYFEQLFGKYPAGMWPPEGGISKQTLKLFMANGIKWIASDEEILANSLDRQFRQNDIYHPYRFQTESGSIITFFRDRELSDKIGFVYSSWTAEEAAEDFLSHLRQIKLKLENEGGNEALKDAVVPIILDGENCWEFYMENGSNFLHLLFQQLNNHPDFKTVTFSEAVKKNEARPLSRIFPGSWINHDFNIWIGDNEDRLAWDMLAKTRRFVLQTQKRKELSADLKEQIWEEIYIAEGSDWCWWYGDDHSSSYDDEFDRLYRNHLIRIYQLLEEDIPEYLFNRIKKKHFVSFQNIVPKYFIYPQIDGKIKYYFDWYDAACYNDIAQQGAMHQNISNIKEILVGFNESALFLALQTGSSDVDADKLVVRFYSPKKISLICDLNTSKCCVSIEKKGRWEAYAGNIKCAIADIMEFEIPFSDLNFKAGDLMKFQVALKEGPQILMQFPQFNLLELPVPDKSYQARNWLV
jgi:alpha-amylase/alpha-mannosidase (GH57 family)